MTKPRRRSLVSNMAETKRLTAAEAPPAAPVAAPMPAKAGLTASGFTSSIHLPREDMALLRRVATERANRNGGRASVSDVIRSLIEEARTRLEQEADRR